MLALSITIVSPAGSVKRGGGPQKSGWDNREAFLTGESCRPRPLRGDDPGALRLPTYRSRAIFGRGIGKISGRRIGLPKKLLTKKPLLNDLGRLDLSGR